MWMDGTAWWMWVLMGAGTIGFWVVVAVTVTALLDGHDRPAGQTGGQDRSKGSWAAPPEAKR